MITKLIWKKHEDRPGLWAGHVTVGEPGKPAAEIVTLTANDEGKELITRGLNGAIVKFNWPSFRETK